MKFSTKDFLSKCDQIRRFLKSLIESFILCAVCVPLLILKIFLVQYVIWWLDSPTSMSPCCETLLAKLQWLTKYLRLTLVFMWKSAQRDKFSFGFIKRFLLVIAKLSFRQGDWALGYHSMGFRHFPNIS